MDEVNEDYDCDTAVNDDDYDYDNVGGWGRNLWHISSKIVHFLYAHSGKSVLFIGFTGERAKVTGD